MGTLEQTNGKLAERVQELEAQIEAAHRAIDSIGLSRCADAHAAVDTDGCVTCDDGKPPLSLADRTKWLITWMTDEPYPMGKRIAALEAENAKLRAELQAREASEEILKTVRLPDGMSYSMAVICIRDFQEVCEQRDAAHAALDELGVDRGDARGDWSLAERIRRLADATADVRRAAHRLMYGEE